MLTQSGVTLGSSRLLNPAKAIAKADHVCCVGGSFAGEVSGVEFGDGGVEVVEVEHDAPDLVVGVDLDDVEYSL